MKFDKAIEREVAKILDAQVKAIAVSRPEDAAIDQVRHAAMKWAKQKAEIRKLEERREEIDRELREIDRKIGK